MHKTCHVVLTAAHPDKDPAPKLWCMNNIGDFGIHWDRVLLCGTWPACWRYSFLLQQHAVLFQLTWG